MLGNVYKFVKVFPSICPLARCCREQGRGRKTEEVTEALVSRESRKENVEGIPKVMMKNKYTITTQQLERKGKKRVWNRGDYILT